MCSSVTDWEGSFVFVHTLMFSSIFDNTSESKLWSGFSWNTGRSSRPATKLEHVINHVFSPVYYPPHKGDFTEENAHALACAVHASACAYSEHIEDANKPHWLRVTKMLENFRVIITPGRPRYQDATSQLGGMKVGGTLCSSLSMSFLSGCRCVSISCKVLRGHISEEGPMYSVRVCPSARMP